MCCHALTLRRFDPDAEVIASAGYRDYQVLVLMEGEDGIWCHGEIQGHNCVPIRVLPMRCMMRVAMIAWQCPCCTVPAVGGGCSSVALVRASVLGMNLR